MTPNSENKLECGVTPNETASVKNSGQSDEVGAELPKISSDGVTGKKAASDRPQMVASAENASAEAGSQTASPTANLQGEVLPADGLSAEDLPAEDLPVGDEDSLFQILEQYMELPPEQLPSKAEIQAKYPELADELWNCLRGMALMQGDASAGSGLSGIPELDSALRGVPGFAPEAILPTLESMESLAPQASGKQAPVALEGTPRSSDRQYPAEPRTTKQSHAEVGGGASTSSRMAAHADEQTAENSGLSMEPIGDFQLVREIGRGGMGVVYEARQCSLGRKVALKILPLASTFDPRQLQRFQNEAAAAAQLEHPSIVPIYAIGNERGIHYYAMRLINGPHLGTMIQQLRQDGKFRSVPDSVTHTDLGTDKQETSVYHLSREGRSKSGNGLNGTPSQSAGTAGLEREKARGAEMSSRASRTNRGEMGTTSGKTEVAGTAGNAGRTKGEGSSVRTEQNTKESLGQTGISTGSIAMVTTQTKLLYSDNRHEFYRTAARLMKQAAEALDYAHQCGIVHRDIKPGNLLVESSGRLWITDFGLAHIQSNVQLTQTGEVFGTPRYMSPEQALGKVRLADHRVDIYSLGATFYEFLTLRPMFEEKNQVQLLRKITQDSPLPPHVLDPQIPHDLETILLKTIEKNPADRYENAGELAKDLERFLDDRPILAKRPSVFEISLKYLRRHPWILVGFVLLVVVAFIVQTINHHMVSVEKQKTTQALAEAQARFQKAREAADTLINLVETDLADETSPTIRKTRQKLLDTALVLYQDFLTMDELDEKTQSQLTANRDYIQRFMRLISDMEGTSMAFLLSSRAVQEELKLTDDQRQKIRQHFDEMNRRGADQFREMRDLQPEQRLEKMAELVRKNDALLTEVLTPLQNKRLTQIGYQLRLESLCDEAVIRKLQLTTEQVAQIQEKLAFQSLEHPTTSRMSMEPGQRPLELGDEPEPGMGHEPPMDGEPPMDRESPMNGEPPLEMEPPRAGEPPMDGEPPVNGELLVNGEPPVDREPPVAMAPPQDGPKPPELDPMTDHVEETVVLGEGVAVVAETSQSAQDQPRSENRDHRTGQPPRRQFRRMPPQRPDAPEGREDFADGRFAPQDGGEMEPSEPSEASEPPEPRERPGRRNSKLREKNGTENAEENVARRGTTPPPFPQDRERTTRRSTYSQQREAEVLAILTDEQRAAWAEMKGEPIQFRIDFRPEAQRRPTFREDRGFQGGFDRKAPNGSRKSQDGKRSETSRNRQGQRKKRKETHTSVTASRNETANAVVPEANPTSKEP